MRSHQLVTHDLRADVFDFNARHLRSGELRWSGTNEKEEKSQRAIAREELCRPVFSLARLDH